MPLLRELTVWLVFVCFVNEVFCKTCATMDVRNNATNLTKLRNCTVIVGNLQINLMEKSEESEFEQFPELTEITGYLLIFRIKNLVSLAKLFPNLKIIRGVDLFMDYSLVVYDMPNLREIGLDNLVTISRGHVIVDKCPNLCYIYSINWIAIGTRLSHGIIANESCQNCPIECKDSCWNSQKCQMPDTDKCHMECLGCIPGMFNSSKHCLVCKNYDNNGTCVAECPSDKYIHLSNKKCLTAEECTKTPLKTDELPWFTYENKCIQKCPPKYERAVVQSKTTCVPCKGICEITCKIEKDEVVETLENIQKLKYCTIINGTLRLRVPNKYTNQTYHELEESLGLIKEITGSLVISRSKAISSLTFFKSLRQINGIELYNNYSIMIFANENLKKLFDFHDPNFNLKILKGKIGFHDNPQLCKNEIITLMNVTGMKNYSSFDVSWITNGYQSSCNIYPLDVRVIHENPTKVTLAWTNLVEVEDKVNIGYTIYYTKDEKSAPAVFESIYFCSGKGWKNIFTANNNITLTNLEPYMQYAYYIEIYRAPNSTKLVNQEEIGQSDFAQSHIMYFRTMPDDPDKPGDIIAYSDNPRSIRMKWARPYITNGVLSYYLINYYRQDYYEYMYEQRNYCRYPFVEEMKEQPKVEVTTMKPPQCSCNNITEEKEEVRLLASDIVTLCDKDAISKFGVAGCKPFAYDIIIQKRNSVKKSRRLETNLQTNYHQITVENTDAVQYVITDLEPYSLYIIFLSACNERTGDKQHCSGVVQGFARTQKNATADLIWEVNASTEGSNATIKWIPPQKPNGVILNYNIQYRLYDYVATKCISKSDFTAAGEKYVLYNLQPGTYTVRIQTVTIAGAAKFSKPVKFTISEYTDNTVWITVIVIVIITIISFVVFIFWFKKKKYENIQLIASINPEYAASLFVEDEWEINRNDIEIQENIGIGAFGKVYSGILKSRNILCAVKIVNDSVSLHDRIEFLNEALVMKSLSDSHHVVKLLGVVSRGQPPMVVMELMDRGDLKSYLRHCRQSSSQNITSNEVYRMSIEIADGMAYLAAKKFVHRDLAARNCMVAHDRTVKIGDFGMTRDIYVTDYYRKGTKGLLPVRWMAPESLADGIFSSQSDVWSYGVVLWEISTLAEQPYQGLSNEEVLQFVITKGKLKRPPECTDDIYEIMKGCWCWRPMNRLTFGDIVEKLISHVGRDFHVVSYYFNRDGHDYMNERNNDALYTRYNVSDEDVQSDPW